MYGDEKFVFNLASEVLIDENIINDEIKEQASSFSFLGLLHKKLVRVADEAEANVKKVYAQEYMNNKENLVIDGKKPTAEDLKQYTTASEDYQKSLTDYYKAKEDADTIGHALKSFEQRAHLIQSISANVRMESKQ